MKRISLLFIFLFLFPSLQETFATNPIAIEWIDGNETLTNEKKQRTFFSKIKKWVQNKIIGAYSSQTLKKMGTIALIIGILSVAGWAFVGAAGPWLIAVIAILAIIGDILSIMTLWNTRKEKKEYRGTRRKAWIALILSLLTGILPLLALILLFASL